MRFSIIAAALMGVAANALAIRTESPQTYGCDPVAEPHKTS